jgi:hypothetical protein
MIERRVDHSPKTAPNAKDIKPTTPIVRTVKGSISMTERAAHMIPAMTAR